tara:strand:+ start:66 stop:542 length:477 start_codon:yes stop_codon:yes gene_type:complete
MTGKTEGEIYKLSLTPTETNSKKLIKEFNKLIVNYNALYTDNKDKNKYTSQINSTYGKNIYNSIKKIKNNANIIYYKAIINLENKSKISNEENTNFSKEFNKFMTKKKDYDNNKDKSSASHKFKLDVYDRNIEDNIFIIYYLLSYGILGLFIYKLLKQ